MQQILFKGGKIVLPEKIIEADLLIREGKIEKIIERSDLYSGKNVEDGGLLIDQVEGEDVKIFDVTDKYILPGLIDVHVHFRTPGFEQKEDWFTGSKAALAGGVTTVFDMPNTNPTTIDIESLQLKREIVANTSLINYGFFVGAALDNLEKVKNLSGIAGIKIYMGSSTGNLLVKDMKSLEGFVAEAKPLLALHAESEECLEHVMADFKGDFAPKVHSSLRPPECAEKALKDLFELVLKYKKKVHICHCSSKKELDFIRTFNNELLVNTLLDGDIKNRLVSVEVTPHHLFLNDQAYEKLNNYARVNPPLRSEEDRKAMWQGIKDGIVTMIATDHAPHLKSEKEQEYLKAPSGMPGVQSMLPLLLNAANEGNLSLEDIVRLTAFNPAHRFGVKNKGMISEGFDADFVVVDLNKEQILKNEEMYSKCGWTPFDGMKIKGVVEKTFVNGELMFDQNSSGENISAKMESAYFGSAKGKEVVFFS